MSDEEDWRRRLNHVLFRIAAIEKIMSSRSVSEIEEDDIAVAAIERHLSVIGEAINFLPDDVTRNYPDVPWEEIYHMRNVLIHGYDIVSISRVIDTALNDLAVLKNIVFEIKARYGA